MKRSQLIATACLLVAIGLAVGGQLAQERRGSGLPDAMVWDKVAAAIKKDFRPGDGVRVQPSWNEALWHRLEGAGEGAERFPFPAFLRGGRVDPMTVFGFKRLWVVGSYGHPPFVNMNAFDGVTTLRSTPFSHGVALRLYHLEPMGWKGSLTGDIRRLKVSRRDKGGKVKPCPVAGKIHRCGKEGWGNPQVATRDVFHNEVNWLYVHAPPGRSTAVVRWHTPSAKTLVLRAGFALRAVRKEPGSVTVLKVFIDDKRVDELRIEPHAYVLHRKAYPLGGKARKVRFEIQAQSHIYRQLLMEADVVERVPAPVERWLETSPR
jgi:hypothetical protein